MNFLTNPVVCQQKDKSRTDVVPNPNPKSLPYTLRKHRNRLYIFEILELNGIHKDNTIIITLLSASCRQSTGFGLKMLPLQ